jgi:IS30 family transposase
VHIENLLRQIGAVVGRGASTISRELRRNPVTGLPHQVTQAHTLAYKRASRLKSAKLHTNTVLRANAEEDLRTKYSPKRRS